MVTTLYGRITAARNVLAAAAEHSIRVSWTCALSSEEQVCRTGHPTLPMRMAKENLRLVPSTDKNMSDAHQQLPYEVCCADGGRDKPKYVICSILSARFKGGMDHPRRLGSADLQWCGGRCKLDC